MKCYIEDCLKNDKIIRWPNSVMPIRVHIAPFKWYKAKENDNYLYKELIIRALKTWQEASGGKVLFQVVPILNESQINVEWKRVDRKALGYCHYNYDSVGRLFSAEVQIGLSDGTIHSQYQDTNEVYHTILHEIGHALGLGHSAVKNDIMYVPHQYGVVDLSKNDRETIKWFYTFGCGASKAEILAKYKKPSGFSLDKLIEEIQTGSAKSEFESNLKKIENPAKSKTLLEQQDQLADINKFNIHLQKITLPEEIKKSIIKYRMQRD